MCLILVGWRAHSGYPLVLAANRDEFFSRPTAPAAFWSDHPQILAGRDLQSGGTWLGVTRAGRVAAVTNYRDGQPQSKEASSRGALVTDFLTSGKSAGEFLASLERDPRQFNGFNLLVGDGRELYCYSNVSGTSHRMAPGIYGLSNHFLDTPWPKVALGKSALADALNALPDESAVFSFLSNTAVFPDHLLPSTGVSVDWERLLSAAFVRAPGYGTRSSSLVKIDRRGRLVFAERTWRDGVAVQSEARYSFRVTPA